MGGLHGIQGTGRSVWRTGLGNSVEEGEKVRRRDDRVRPIVSEEGLYLTQDDSTQPLNLRDE